MTTELESIKKDIEGVEKAMLSGIPEYIIISEILKILKSILVEINKAGQTADPRNWSNQ